METSSVEIRLKRRNGTPATWSVTSYLAEPTVIAAQHAAARAAVELVASLERAGDERLAAILAEDNSFMEV